MASSTGAPSSPPIANSPEGSAPNPRRSARLMESSKTQTKTKPTKRAKTVKVAEIESFPRQQRLTLMALGTSPTELDIHNLSDTVKDILSECAILSLRDHNMDDLPHKERFHFLKIDEAFEIKKGVKGKIYSIIFQAENGLKCKATFEADIRYTTMQMKVIRIRTVGPPEGIWVPGTYCIPNPLDHKYILGSLASCAFLKLDSPSSKQKIISAIPCKPNGRSSYKLMNSDSLDTEMDAEKRKAKKETTKNGKDNNKANEKSNKSGKDDNSGTRPPVAKLAQTCGRIIRHELVLDELPVERTIILDECASLVLLDHNVRCNADFRLSKIEKAIRSRIEGDYYTLTFQAVSDTKGKATTFEAKVWDPHFQRQVIDFRTIRPKRGRWVSGTYCIPKFD